MTATDSTTTEGSVGIRRLAASDVDAFRDIRLEALARHPEAFGASVEDETRLSTVEWRERLEKGLVFGAWQDDRLVAIMGFAQSARSKLAHIASIWGVYVRPEARCSSVASQLLAHVLEHAQGRVRSVRLTVTASNTAALQLYENAGFVAFARDREALRIGDSFHDEVLMRLDLSA